MRYNAHGYIILTKRVAARSCIFFPRIEYGVSGRTRGVVMRLRWWAAIGLLLAALGGGGLWLMVTRVWPDQDMELALLGLLAITLGGLTIPVAAYLNHRFARPGWQSGHVQLLRDG